MLSPSLLGPFFQDSVRFFQRYLLSLACLVLPLSVLVNSSIALLLAEQPEQLAVTDIALPALFSIAASSLSGAALIYFIAGRIAGPAVGVSQSYAMALGVFASFFTLSLLETLLVLTGLSLLVFPGLYIQSRLAFTGFALLLEKRSIAEAIKTSWRDTASCQWLLFVGMVVPYYGVNLLAKQLLTLAPDSLSLQISVSCLEDVIAVIWLLFAYRVYDRLHQTNGPRASQ